MKIRDDNGVPRGLAPHMRPVRESQLHPKLQTHSPARAKGDRVELSDRARSLYAAKEALSRLPEIRQDRVESLKKAIQAGTYRVSGEQLAERMLREGIFA